MKILPKDFSQVPKVWSDLKCLKPALARIVHILIWPMQHLQTWLF